jgi:sugar (pentulose or hexulose) kinase
MIMGMIINPGLLVRWASRTLQAGRGGRARSLDALIDAALTGRPPSHVTVLPYLSGRGTPEMNALVEERARTPISSSGAMWG